MKDRMLSKTSSGTRAETPKVHKRAWAEFMATAFRNMLLVPDVRRGCLRSGRRNSGSTNAPRTCAGVEETCRK